MDRIKNLSLDQKAKLYYMMLLKKGVIDTLPEDPKAAYVQSMMDEPASSKFSEPMGEDHSEAENEKLKKISKELNKAIGGAYKIRDGEYIATSQHCKGEAADLHYVDGKGNANNKLLFDTILDMGLEFDQMINEFDYSWIHISYSKDNNRCQLLEAYKDNGRTKYKKFKELKSL